MSKNSRTMEHVVGEHRYNVILLKNSGFVLPIFFTLLEHELCFCWRLQKPPLHNWCHRADLTLGIFYSQRLRGKPSRRLDPGRVSRFSSGEGGKNWGNIFSDGWKTPGTQNPRERATLAICSCCPASQKGRRHLQIADITALLLTMLTYLLLSFICQLH